MGIKAALFDFDGTLVDTENIYSVFWKGICDRFCPDRQDLPLLIKGHTLKDILGEYFPSEDERQAITGGLDELEERMPYVLYPGAREFLEDLKRHAVRTAIVTSSMSRKMSIVASRIEGFHELFDKVLTAEEFSASKPDPDCYLRAAAALDTPLEDCVVFEDAISGLQAGMASGIRTVGLPHTLPEDVVKDHCHLLIHTYEGLTVETLAAMLAKIS